MKPSNFDKAKDNARTRDAERGDGKHTNDERDPRAEDSLPSAGRVPATNTSGVKWKKSARFVRLEENDAVEGRFVRWGAVKASPEPDKLTGEIIVKELRTVILDCGGGDSIEFLSAHEIDRQLVGVKVGEAVRITRRKERNVGKIRVTSYECEREDDAS